LGLLRGARRLSGGGGATVRCAARRTQEGKSAREIKRCLKRAIAREVYQLMETHAAAVAANLPKAA